MSFLKGLESLHNKRKKAAETSTKSSIGDEIDENIAKKSKPTESGSSSSSALKRALERRELGIIEPEKMPDVVNPLTTTQGDFAVIGQKHGTDKVTHHGYHRFYPRYLEFYRSTILRVDPTAVENKSKPSHDSKSNDTTDATTTDSTAVSAAATATTHKGYGMLEIGIDESASLKTWLEYFPSPTFIYGLDIHPKANPRGERYHLLTGDQSDLVRLQRMMDEDIHHSIFFIIDDGSHIPEHQLKTFNLLFSKLLLPGGTYIIEDLETSYWTQGGLYGYPTKYGYRHSKSAIEILKMVVDDINHEYLSDEVKEEHNKSAISRYLDQETRSKISSITFGQNCAVILKKTEEEMTVYNNRQYRFFRHL